jgi:hypothetical protein
VTFRYFDYLNHFLGGLLLSYSYFIFRLLLGQPLHEMSFKRTFHASKKNSQQI